MNSELKICRFCKNIQTLHGMPGILFICRNKHSHSKLWHAVEPQGTCSNFRTGRVPDHIAHAVSDPDTRIISLQLGQFAILDADDYEQLKDYRWNLFAIRENRYAERRQGNKHIPMHRQIMNPQKDMVVDHVDHNGLNNRRCNLRVCTVAENSRNQKINKQNKASKYRGVCKKKCKWIAAINYERKKYYLGSFDLEIQAAGAYDKMAKELHGEFASLNFPEEPA